METFTQTILFLKFLVHNKYAHLFMRTKFSNTLNLKLGQNLPKSVTWPKFNLFVAFQNNFQPLVKHKYIKILTKNALLWWIFVVNTCNFGQLIWIIGTYKHCGLFWTKRRTSKNVQISSTAEAQSIFTGSFFIKKYIFYIIKMYFIYLDLFKYP